MANFNDGLYGSFTASKKIGIFGSFVRAAQDNKSDIDVLVEFKKLEKFPAS